MLTFLKGVKENNALEGDAVMKQIRGMKIDDMFARNAYLREDGRLVHDMYLVEVKKPSESKARWDYYKILRTIPGENAFRPLNQGGCPLVAGRWSQPSRRPGSRPPRCSLAGTVQTAPAIFLWTQRIIG